MNVVLDTNVLVSGMINAFGVPGRIVDLVRSGALQLVVDDRIFAEYNDVLNREELPRYFTISDRDAVMEHIFRDSRRIACNVVLKDLPDCDDAPFLEAAVTAQVPLVTGNLKHYPPSIRRNAVVLSPKEFLDFFTQSSGSDFT